MSMLVSILGSSAPTAWSVVPPSEELDEVERTVFKSGEVGSKEEVRVLNQAETVALIQLVVAVLRSEQQPWKDQRDSLCSAIFRLSTFALPTAKEPLLWKAFADLFEAAAGEDEESKDKAITDSEKPHTPEPRSHVLTPEQRGQFKGFGALYRAFASLNPVPDVPPSLFDELLTFFHAPNQRFTSRTAPRVLRVLKQHPGLLKTPGLFAAISSRIIAGRLVLRTNCVEALLTIANSDLGAYVLCPSLIPDLEGTPSSPPTKCSKCHSPPSSDKATFCHKCAQPLGITISAVKLLGESGLQSLAKHYDELFSHIVAEVRHNFLRLVADKEGQLEHLPAATCWPLLETVCSDNDSPNKSKALDDLSQFIHRWGMRNLPEVFGSAADALAPEVVFQKAMQHFDALAAASEARAQTKPHIVDMAGARAAKEYEEMRAMLSWKQTEITSLERDPSFLPPALPSSPTLSSSTPSPAPPALPVSASSTQGLTPIMMTFKPLPNAKKTPINVFFKGSVASAEPPPSAPPASVGITTSSFADHNFDVRVRFVNPALEDVSSDPALQNVDGNALVITLRPSEAEAPANWVAWTHVVVLLRPPVDLDEEQIPLQASDEVAFTSNAPWVTVIPIAEVPELDLTKWAVSFRWRTWAALNLICRRVLPSLDDKALTTNVSRELMELPRSLLQHCFASDRLPVQHEASVLLFMLRLAKHFSSEIGLLESLLPSVRLAYVPASEAWQFLCTHKELRCPLFCEMLKRRLKQAFTGSVDHGTRDEPKRQFYVETDPLEEQDLLVNRLVTNVCDLANKLDEGK